MLGNALGYADPNYITTLSAHGAPQRLGHSHGWILKRRIPGSDRYDANGPYPLFQCRYWTKIGNDLADLRGSGFVSVTLVSDPIIDEVKKTCFGYFDVARPFKLHYITDLNCPMEQYVSSHHRRYTRKAERTLSLDIPDAPLNYVDEWCQLYQAIRKRHAIGDLRAFSRTAFESLFAMKGIVYLRALKDGVAVGGQVFVRDAVTAYAHLSAFSTLGYKYGASYFLDGAAIRYFRGRVGLIDWGGGLSLVGDAPDGLALYKKGWASHERTSFVLGAILDRAYYDHAIQDLRNADSNFFPLYRAGEFRRSHRCNK